MAKFTPFPTFGGKQGITGVQPIQLPQVRTSFPTARPPARRAPEPTTKEKLGGLAPLFLRGAAELFRSKPQPMLTPTKFYESIGADPEDPSRNEQAQLAAYTAYGPQRDVGGFRGMDLADIVVASQMGRGAPQYVSSALKLRQAEDVRDTNINTQRGQLIKELSKPEKFSNVVVIDKNAAELGLNPYLQGRKSQESGKLQILDPKEGFIDAGANYILKTGTSNVNIKEDPNKKYVNETFATFYEKEHTLNDLISIANPLIEQYKNLGEGDVVPGTITASLVGFADEVLREVDNIGKVMGLKDDSPLFGTNTNLGGSYGRQGNGTVSKLLYEVLNDPDATESQKDNALKAFESMIEKETGRTLEDLFGTTVYNDVRTRSRFLQLAYVAAAVNGQTGRTLSDKDLAYHIEIVGLGQTTSPEVLVANLTDFVADSINQVDNGIKLAISQQFPRMRLQLDDPYMQSFLSDFYVPNEKDVYSQSLNDYTYRPFAERRSTVTGAQNFIKGSTINTAPITDKDELKTSITNTINTGSA